MRKKVNRKLTPVRKKAPKKKGNTPKVRETHTNSVDIKRPTIVLHWIFRGSRTRGVPSFRAENPWAKALAFIDSKTRAGRRFFEKHDAVATRMGRDFTVWRVKLPKDGSANGVAIDEVALELCDRLGKLVQRPVVGDHIWAWYFDDDRRGIAEWL